MVFVEISKKCRIKILFSDLEIYKNYDWNLRRLENEIVFHIATSGFSRPRFEKRGRRRDNPISLSVIQQPAVKIDDNRENLFVYSISYVAHIFGSKGTKKNSRIKNH